VGKKDAPGRKQVHSFANMARVEAGKGIASADALPGPEDLDHYERLCNALLKRLYVLYPKTPWKVDAWRCKRLMLESYSEILQNLRGRRILIVMRTVERAVRMVDRDAKAIMREMLGGRNAR